MKVVFTACVVAVVCLWPARAEFIIDAFTTPQEAAINAGRSNPVLVDSNVFSTGETMLGGQRELVVRRDKGNGTASVDVGLTLDAGLSFATAATTRAWALITWDGPGTGTAKGSFNPAAGLHGTPDTFGLGGLDLTDGGRNNRLRVRAYADLGLSMLFTFYTSVNSYATAVLMLPAGSRDENDDPILDIYDIPLSSFTIAGGAPSGGILRDVTAVTLELSGPAGVDMVLGYLVLTHSPEPGTGLLFGAAVLLAAGTRLRRALRR